MPGFQGARYESELSPAGCVAWSLVRQPPVVLVLNLHIWATLDPAMKLWAGRVKVHDPLSACDMLSIQ